MAETTYDLVIRAERVCTTAGFQPREVGITAGRIEAMEPLGNNLVGDEVIDGAISSRLAAARAGLPD